MNIKMIALISYLLCVQAAYTIPIPLTVMNVTNDTIEFTFIFEKNRLAVPIAARSSWKHTIENNSLSAIEWRNYSEKDRVWHDYNLTINKQIPTFNKYGGTIVIAGEGGFLYDNKRKGPNLVGGQANIAS